MKPRPLSHLKSPLRLLLYVSHARRPRVLAHSRVPPAPHAAPAIACPVPAECRRAPASKARCGCRSDVRTCAALSATPVQCLLHWHACGMQQQFAHIASSREHLRRFRPPPGRSVHASPLAWASRSNCTCILRKRQRLRNRIVSSRAEISLLRHGCFALQRPGAGFPSRRRDGWRALRAASVRPRTGRSAREEEINFATNLFVMAHRHTNDRTEASLLAMRQVRRMIGTDRNDPRPGAPKACRNCTDPPSGGAPRLPWPPAVRSMPASRTLVVLVGPAQRPPSACTTLATCSTKPRASATPA